MKQTQTYSPVVATAKIKWWKPWGAAFLIVRSGFRFFVTGTEIRGAGDNATFLHDATIDYRGRPVEKLTRARWRRVLVRWLLIGIPGLLLALNLTAEAIRAVSGFFDAGAPAWTAFPFGWTLLAYLFALLCAAVAWGGPQIAAWWEVRDVRKTFIYPAAEVLSRTTGVKLNRRAKLAAIELPDGFGEEHEGEPEPVRVYVPEVVLDDAMKLRIAKAVGARIGLPDPIAKWTESGVPVRYCDLYPQALPPARVSLEELLEELLAGDMDHPLVGLMSGGRVSRMDMKNDSPHTLGSAGSGGGKSTLYRLIAMQRLRLGAYAIILDFKKWSHLRWAGRLPEGRVRIEDEVPAIHDLLCRVLDELLWRKSFDLAQEDELAKLPVIDVYVEEINTLMDLLTEYWGMERARMKQAARTRLRRAKEAVKTAGAEGEAPDELLAEVDEAEENLAQAMGLPTKSPALQALKYGVNLGREFRIHFHFIGQSMSAKAAGGRDTRESFKTRLLARWDLKTWKMLADGIPFVSDPGGDVGIWAHVHDGRAEIVRVPFVPDEFAVSYVRDGERPSLPMFHGDPRPTIEQDASPAAIGRTMGLTEIVGILPLKADGDRMTIKALRLAAGRDGFPTPVVAAEPGKAALFDPEEVLAWFRDRERIPSLGS
jgi:hypothetical protein